MKYKNQLPKTVTFYNLVLLGLAVLLIVSAVFNFLYFKSDLKRSSLEQANTENTSQLKTYEEGYASTVDNYYSGALSDIESIASDNSTLQAAQSNNTAALSSAFDQARAYSPAFNSIAAFGANGDMLAISTNAPSVTPNLTVSKLSPVVQSAIKSRIPTVCPGYLSSADRLVVAFVAPITGPNGAYEGSIVGDTTLSSLGTYTNYLEKGGDITGTLVDSEGQVLVHSGTASTSLNPIATKEPLLWYAGHTNSITVRNETNYLGQNVLAAGVKVTLSGAGDVYVLSYIPESHLTSVADQSEDSILSFYRSFLGINLLSVLITVALAYYVVRFKKADKDKRAQEQTPR